MYKKRAMILEGSGENINFFLLTATCIIINLKNSDLSFKV